MNTICPTCQTKNKLPAERLAENPRCGRCNSELFNGHVIQANAENFDILQQDDLPIVIDFWAPWCGPCLNFAPTFETISSEFSQKARFIKVNTEQLPEISIRYRIVSIPTIMVFKNGDLVDSLHGALPKVHFAQWLNNALTSNQIVS